MSPAEMRESAARAVEASGLEPGERMDTTALLRALPIEAPACPHVLPPGLPCYVCRPEPPAAETLGSDGDALVHVRGGCLVHVGEGVATPLPRDESVRLALEVLGAAARPDEARYAAACDEREAQRARADAAERARDSLIDEAAGLRLDRGNASLRALDREAERNQARQEAAALRGRIKEARGHLDEALKVAGARGMMRAADALAALSAESPPRGPVPAMPDTCPACAAPARRGAP